MTQKKLDWAKKKAKECLDIFNIKVPMVKMTDVACSKINDGWSVLFIDIRTKDIYSCTYYSNVYHVYIRSYNTGKQTSYTRKEFVYD